MEIYKVHMNLFRMLLTIVVNMFDVHILNCPNNSMALIMDFVDHFHNGISDIYRRYSVMFDYCSNRIYILQKKNEEELIKKMFSKKYISEMFAYDHHQPFQNVYFDLNQPVEKVTEYLKKINK